VTPYYRQLYFDLDVKLDPCTTGPFFAAIGEAVTTADAIPCEEFLQTRIIGSRRSRRAVSTL
jgi:hypothetical protein